MKQYDVTRLVWYESNAHIDEAIVWEKVLKKWRRDSHARHPSPLQHRSHGLPLPVPIIPVFLHLFAHARHEILGILEIAGRSKATLAQALAPAMALAAGEGKLQHVRKAAQDVVAIGKGGREDSARLMKSSGDGSSCNELS
jgi:hypothetical protein